MKDLKNTITELCKYYMEFLESDFRSNRLPSRRIEFDIEEGKKIIDLQKYNDFESKAFKCFTDKFSSNGLKIGKNQFIIKLPNEIITKILDVIKKNNYVIDRPVKSRISKILNDCDAFNEDKISKIIEDIAQSPESAHEYLKGIVVGDLFDETFELWKNKQLKEKEEFYLYFYEIKYKNNKYPLFYIQLSTGMNDKGEYELEFNPVLLVNKKAIQYISENYAKEKDLKWKIDLPARQIYLGNYNEVEEYIKLLQSILNEVTNFFGLDSIDLNDKNEESITNNGIEISRKSYLALFDKSDEAILNDYEEMLNLILSQNSSMSLDFLMKLSKEFIFQNPKTFHNEVETEFAQKPLGDKLNYHNPVPLNKEQLQVLQALNKNGCDRIIIHGPPGTGKSHTITAIIYDALLNKKSVLVVSDKKEALDVVEDKITEVIEKVKIDDYIQNPILRLGKTETNYNSIFTQANYDRIKNRYYAYSKTKEQIENQIKWINDKIVKDIDKNVNFELSLNPKVIKWLLEYEKTYNHEWEGIIDSEEIIKNDIYEEFKNLYQKVNEFVRRSNEIRTTFGTDITELYPNYIELNKILKRIVELASQVKDYARKENLKFYFKENISEITLGTLEGAVEEFVQMRNPIFGYLFCSKRLIGLQNKISGEFVNGESFNLKKDYALISKELQFYRKIKAVNSDFKSVGCDCFELFRHNTLELFLESIKGVVEVLNSFESFRQKLPKTIEKLGLDFKDLSTLSSNKLLNFELDDINSLITYLKHNEKIRESENCNLDEFLDDRKQIENRLILKMTNILDESVINFRENYKNDAEELKKIIKQRKKISKSLLEKLVNAFPCLIVNIRDLGEYIPLEANIFDLVIIDEASQVSVAQAFPAIIRGKKIVVLGDEKQFSNVKSHNASIEINNYLFNKVKAAFCEDIKDYDDDMKDMLLGKIENFSVKNSILNFIKNIANYECSLKKHFRGYMEIIGYSNKIFYGNTLKVMKIRGKSIDNVIKIIKVNPGEKKEIYKNANQAEAECIIDELRRLRDSGFKGTVGVITPFTNQQRLISNIIYNSGDWREFEDSFKLKIMTFDSCQGDEKDIIYYSMVERADEELLKYIFPVDLSKINFEEDGNLKAQRLNVGLSRAKESVRFVVSKDIDNFKGEIGNALKQFAKYLSEPDNFGVIAKTDPKSPMEKVVYNYIVQTRFYQNNKDRLEIIPQFDVGRYIKQLDPYAKIPNYRTDFLLILKDGEREKFIIVEYDGFEYHFTDSYGYIDELNYEKFYIESDIERQKTIELYGYKFIRVNKFNLGNNPVERLNSRLEKVVKKN